MNSKEKLNPPKVLDRTSKIAIRFTGSFLVIATVTHGIWYCLREMYVPKEDQTPHPILRVLDKYFKVDKGEISNMRNHEKT